MLLDTYIGGFGLGGMEEIYEQKGVALDNLFNVSILPPQIVKDKFPNVKWENLSFRVKSFSIPEDTTTTEDITIRGITVSKSVGVLNTNNDVSFDLTVDRDFENYKAFHYWKGLSGEAGNGFRATSLSKVRGIIYLESSEKMITWRFKNVQLVSIGEVSYDYSSGEPISVSLQFKFAGYEVL